jgi:hypothetical protein
MAKVTGSYESVVRGVSQQVPQDRRSGQHYAQENMISDPVRGLARRHGSKLLDEQAIAGAASFADRLADTTYHKATTFYVDGIEYDIIYRTTASTAGTATFAWAFNRSTGKFLPIQYAMGDPVLDDLVSGGVSAATNVGRYVYLAGNTIVPAWEATDAFGTSGNQSKAVAWVRGGAYSRTFKVTLTKANGSKIVGSYKTKSSSYPTLLDTSDITPANPNYQQLVNDRVYEYNSKVTQWIGIAAADITPENIATQLAADLTAKGVAGVSIVAGTVTINDPTIVEAAGEDGGDGTLLHVVGSELQSAELVSTVHWVGKIVKIRPQRSKGDDAFYLKAYPKDEGTVGFTEVAWRESAGYVMQPTTLVAMGTVYNGVMYLAGGPLTLEAMVGIDTPDYKANAVGDAITSPLPYLFGKRIDYLGVFQDKLIIGSGATILASRPGDYLNLFRQSVLTVTDSDPWEGYALGAEDDIIKFSVTYDRNLLLFGERFQYVISGRQVLSPKGGANIAIATAYEDAVDCAPQASGNFVFYAKHGGQDVTKSSIHQIQAGAIADSPESFEVSQALDTYIRGKTVELVAMTTPNMIMLRTDADRSRLWTYGYLDNANGSERLTDSWSDWSWHDAVGAAVGLSAHKGTLLVYLLRQRDGGSYMACERFVRDTGLSEYPYADSLRPLTATPPADTIVALQRTGTANPLMGQPIASVAPFRTMYAADLARAWVGYEYPSFVTPTNPYMKDRNGRSILNGRLTLGRVIVAFADTGGLRVEVDTTSGQKVSLDFNGRILGHDSNVAGQQPILSTSLSAVVGREVRECTYTLKARTWLPLTITAIEWTGQYFSNARRV